MVQLALEALKPGLIKKKLRKDRGQPSQGGHTSAMNKAVQGDVQPSP